MRRATMRRAPMIASARTPIDADAAKIRCRDALRYAPLMRAVPRLIRAADYVARVRHAAA